MTVQKKQLYSKFNIYWAAFLANLCATAATCIMSWSSPTLPLITKPGGKIFVTTDQGAWLSSIPALGASLGPLCAGRIADLFGRKPTLLAVNFVFMATWAVIYYTESWLVILFSRFVGGLGVGCVYAALPMFMGEIAPVNLRGSLGSLLQLFDCFAYLIEYIVGSYVSYERLIIVSAALPLVCILTFMWVPESPYHLHNKGQDVKAIKALQFFRGYADPTTLQKEIKELQASAENIKNNKSSFISLFTYKNNLRSLYYCAGLVICQQGSGINVITFYSKTIFEESGSTFSANLCSVIVVSVMTFAACLTPTAARVFRIKYCLLFSSVGITLSMFTLGTYFYLKELDSEMTERYGMVPVISLVVFIFTYTIGYGPLTWVITSELFPFHLKALGCALTASFSWILAFLLTRYFMPFSEDYGKAPAFWLFSCIGVISYLFVDCQLPETQGKTFQEIQEMIHGPTTGSENPNGIAESP